MPSDRPRARRTTLGHLSITTRSWARYQRLAGALPWLGGWSPFPLHLDLVLSWRCNLACPMCNLRQEHNMQAFAEFQRGEMSVADWRRIIDDARRSFPLRPNLNLLGGEPTLYKGYPDIIAYAKQRGFRCTFVTNGTHLERDADLLVASGIDVITVSLDGGEALHDSIRGVGVFQRAVRGVRRLQELKRERGSRQPSLFMATAVNGANHARLSEAVEVAASLNIESLTFLHLQFPDSGLEAHGVEAPVLLEAMSEAESRARELGVRMHFYPFLRRDQIATYYHQPSDRLGQRCLSPWLRLTVLPDGHVIPCGDVIVGTVSEGGDSLRAVWNGGRLRDFRRRLARQGAILPACQRCCRRLY